MGQYYIITVLGSNYCIVPRFGYKLTEHCYIDDETVRRVERLLSPGDHWYKKRVVWAGDYADKEKDSDTNLHGMELKDLSGVTEPVPRSLNYVINHDKKQYVEVRKGKEVDGVQYHPLPLLCVEGNGRGGGDYKGESSLVGSWARDRISCEDNKPEDEEYTELLFDLCKNDY